MSRAKAIREALDLLDPSGVTLIAVRELTGDSEITQGDLDAVLKRKGKPTPAVAEPVETQEPYLLAVEEARSAMLAAHKALAEAKAAYHAAERKLEEAEAERARNAPEMSFHDRVKAVQERSKAERRKRAEAARLAFAAMPQKAPIDRAFAMKKMTTSTYPLLKG